MDIQKHSEFISWYDSLNSNNILLMFKGDFNQELIRALVLLVEGLADVNREKPVVRSRLTNAIVECLQNICRHGESYGVKTGLKPGMLMVRKDDREFVIAIANYVLTRREGNIREYMEHVRNMNPDDLKNFHKEVLKSTELYGKYGADLGLINIARRSRRQFAYHFKKLDDNYSFFSFETAISLSE